MGIGPYLAYTDNARRANPVRQLFWGLYTALKETADGLCKCWFGGVQNKTSR